MNKKYKPKPKPRPVPCLLAILLAALLPACVVPSESHTLNLATGSFEGSSVWTGKDTKAKYTKKITRLGEDGKPIVEEVTLELDRKTELSAAMQAKIAELQMVGQSIQQGIQLGQAVAAGLGVASRPQN